MLTLLQPYLGHMSYEIPVAPQIVGEEDGKIFDLKHEDKTTSRPFKDIILDEVVHIDSIWPPFKVSKKNLLIFSAANLFWVFLIGLFLAYTVMTIDNAFSNRKNPPTSITITPVPSEGFKFPYISVCLTSSTTSIDALVDPTNCRVNNFEVKRDASNGGSSTFLNNLPCDIIYFPDHDLECVSFTIPSSINTYYNQILWMLTINKSVGFYKMFITGKLPNTNNFEYLSQEGFWIQLYEGLESFATLKKTTRKMLDLSSMSYPAKYLPDADSFAVIGTVAGDACPSLPCYSTHNFYADPSGITTILENDPVDPTAIIGSISGVFSVLSAIFFFVFAKPIYLYEEKNRREQIQLAINPDASIGEE